ncbi:PIN domain-containing protein [Candidatus Daviesbacteria bacterium]|nr:PIN domain-containing protein [Candidatus Daviesbacteria bacterium]
MKDVFVDSNILIRFITRDVEEQYQKSRSFFESIEEREVNALVSILVVNEVVWILEKFYKIKRKIFLPQLIKLLILKNIKIIEVEKELMAKVLEKMIKRKQDFTDIYLSQIAKKDELFSFDQDFEKLYKN